MTSGHEAVKADLVAHLSANIGDWVDVVAVDSWPPAPALVAATDILPVDEDKPWPCVLVSTTSMSTTTRDAGVGSGADSYTHHRAHATPEHPACRIPLEQNNTPH